MNAPLTQDIRLDQPPDLAAYQAAGGYRALRKALGMSPQEVQALVRNSGLKGRGGAGFLTGLKWSFVPMGPDTGVKYLLVNADELEPGTFKDRLLLEGNPHQLLEGALIAAYAIGAQEAYVFIRWAYKLAARRMKAAIEQAQAAGLVGDRVAGGGWSCRVHVHSSAGRYMCGEETGLINALQGRRATPRAKPPFPQTVGLWGRPTVVNNVETLCNVPHIVENGPQWFRSLARSPDEAGTKIYGASGHVKNPGLWELPLGVTMNELMERAGGMAEGYALRAVLPGGASTAFVLKQNGDVPMDFTHLPKVGSRLGTGTMIVLDDRTCPVGLLHNLSHFFAVQSCGWCTPCREGLPWVEHALEALESGTGSRGDIEVLQMHAEMLRGGNTFCALAPGAMEPLASALKYFMDDFEKHVELNRCPYAGGI
jgi:NADH-quinone oxidoreductase subunit F